MASATKIEYGFCQCGCGQRTTVATRTDSRRGSVKGEPRRYVLGHGMAGKKQNPFVMAARSYKGPCEPGCQCGRHSSGPKISAAQKGRKASSSTKAKMTASQRSRHAKMTPAQKRARSKKLRESWAKRKYDPSSIEIVVRGELDKIGVEWLGGQVVSGFMPDLVLPKLKIIIEIQGCYWHGCLQCYESRSKAQTRIAKRDKIKRGAYRKAGYRMVEIWEHEIKANAKNAVMEAIFNG